jgi:hypothetical protein
MMAIEVVVSQDKKHRFYSEQKDHGRDRRRREEEKNE